MARQSNILSYDEMRRGNKARSHHISAPSQNTMRNKQSRQPSSIVSKNQYGSQASVETAQDTSLLRERRSASLAKENNYFAQWGSVVKRNTRTSAPLSSGRRVQAPSKSQPSGRISRVASVSDVHRYDNEAAVSEADRKGNSGKISKLSHFKKQLTKSKAGKEFTKQFGDTTSEAASSGSRAAVYKAEMGKSHKRASAMQASPSRKQGVFRRFSLSGFNFRKSPKAIASLMVAVCLIASCAFLYPTAQQYYTKTREHDKLSAEYSALQERNSGIESSVNSLSTEQGIEDRARSEFGWVKEGENAVNVMGLEKTIEGAKSSISVIVPGSIEAPETWYSPILDVVFGYE